MGSGDSRDQQSFSKDDWRLVEERLDRSVWRHRTRPSLLIEEKPQPTPPELHFQQTMAALWRRKCPHLVSSYQMEAASEGYPCESVREQVMFVEHTPIRLSHVEHIPFPDYLHLCQALLVGFEFLSSKTHFFAVEEGMVGFTVEGVAKVWLNADYWSLLPPQKAVSESQMVRSILLMVGECIDELPPPSVAHLTSFMYRNWAELSFNTALAEFEEYVRQYCPQGVPPKMECFEKVGGTKLISDKVGQMRAKHQAKVAEEEAGAVRESLVEYYAVVTPPPQAKQPEPLQATTSRRQGSFAFLRQKGQLDLHLTPQRTQRTAIDSLPLTMRNSSLQPSHTPSYSTRKQTVSPFMRDSKIETTQRQLLSSNDKPIITIPPPTIRLAKQPSQQTPKVHEEQGTGAASKAVRQGLPARPMALTHTPPSITFAGSQPKTQVRVVAPSQSVPFYFNKRQGEECSVCREVSRVRFSRVPHPQRASPARPARSVRAAVRPAPPSPSG